MESLSKITEEFEIIAVNDGSSDASLSLLKEYNLKDNRFKVLSLSRNFGHQAAFLAGLKHTRGKTIGMIDGDLQDPPEILYKFYEKIAEGFDVVYAVRKKRKEGVFKKLAYWLYYRILDKVAEVPIPHDSGDFSMITRRALDYMLDSTESSLFIRGIRSWVGFKQIGIEYNRDKRFGGEPKYNLKTLFKLAYNGIFSFSKFPVKFLTNLGGVVVLVSIIYSMYSLYIRLFTDKAPEGFTTLAIAIFLFSGIQLMSLGIIGEYVLRIYDEARNRPLYIVESFDN
jgi:dolichol-phosphate mannosyltransferase